LTGTAIIDILKINIYYELSIVGNFYIFAYRQLSYFKNEVYFVFSGWFSALFSVVFNGS